MITGLLLYTIQGGPCSGSNPPPWCNGSGGGSGGPCSGSNPPQWCVQVPIEDYWLVLAVAGVILAYYMLIVKPSKYKK